jgi:hypothetical protein
MVFGGICSVQSAWFVFDEPLKEEIRISIAKVFPPAYENFIEKIQSAPELSQHAEKHIKYRTKDIKARLGDLFQKNSYQLVAEQMRSLSCIIFCVQVFVDQIGFKT